MSPRLESCPLCGEPLKTELRHHLPNCSERDLGLGLEGDQEAPQR